MGEQSKNAKRNPFTNRSYEGSGEALITDNQYAVLFNGEFNTIVGIQERLANFNNPYPGEAYELSKALWHCLEEARKSLNLFENKDEHKEALNAVLSITMDSLQGGE